MTPVTVRRVVIEILDRMVGGNDAPEIDDETDPIHALGLISDDGLDFACEISEQLGFHFPNKLNPFIDDSGHRARTVGQIIELISSMISDAKEAHSG